MKEILGPFIVDICSIKLYPYFISKDGVVGKGPVHVLHLVVRSAHNVSVLTLVHVVKYNLNVLT